MKIKKKLYKKLCNPKSFKIDKFALAKVLEQLVEICSEDTEVLEDVQKLSEKIKKLAEHEKREEEMGVPFIQKSFGPFGDQEKLM